jgi:hypothetical protein
MAIPEIIRAGWHRFVSATLFQVVALGSLPGSKATPPRPSVSPQLIHYGMIRFDNLPAYIPADRVTAPKAGYAGLNWSNVGLERLEFFEDYLFSGVGTYTLARSPFGSAPNVAHNGYVNVPCSILAKPGTIFNVAALSMAAYTSLYQDSCSVRIEGFRSGLPVDGYDRTVVLSPYYARSVALAYYAIDELRLTSLDRSNFVFDNVLDVVTTKLSLTTLPPDDLTATATTLQAVVYPSNLDTTVEFFVGTASKGTVVVPANVGLQCVSLPVQGLIPKTRYTCRAVARSGKSKITGAALKFVTPAQQHYEPLPFTISDQTPGHYSGASGGGLKWRNAQALNPSFFNFPSFARLANSAIGSPPTIVAPFDYNDPVSIKAPDGSLFDVGTLAMIGFGRYEDSTESVWIQGYRYGIPVEGAGFGMDLPHQPQLVRVDFASIDELRISGWAAFDNLTETIPAGPAVAPVGPSWPEEVGPDSATLKASVFPNGQETTVEFFLGTESKGTVTLVGTGRRQLVSLPVSGLTPSTDYLYHVVATSADGSSTGWELGFQTRVLPEASSPD